MLILAFYNRRQILIFGDLSGNLRLLFIDHFLIFQNNLIGGKQDIFPICRWIRTEEPLTVQPYDCELPDDSYGIVGRKRELDSKRTDYQLDVKEEGMPPMVSSPGSLLLRRHDAVANLLANGSLVCLKATTSLAKCLTAVLYCGNKAHRS